MHLVLFFGEGVTDVGAEGTRTLVLTEDSVDANNGGGELCGAIPILVYLAACYDRSSCHCRTK